MSTVETLIRYLSDDLPHHVGAPGLAEDDNLLTGGLMSSLGVMRLIVFIEEAFKLDVPPEDVTIENFRSVRCIADYLERRMVVGSAIE
jgi:acyl carrier protein